MSTQRKLKAGMVGVGGFGGHRRERMRDSGLFELVAAYDHNAEALKQARQQDGAEATQSYDALLARADIEAVFVATGAKFHAEQAIAAARAGKHVFVEKPLVSTPEEVRALAAAQRETGVVIGCGHADHGRDPISARTKQLIDSGELGDIAVFEATTAHSGGWLIKPGDWRGDPDRNPGGMLFQCGVHKLHELMFYFGPVKTVQAVMRYDVHTTGTADVACCLLTFESGVVGNLNAYHVTPSSHTLSIFGTKAAILHELHFGKQTLLRQDLPAVLDGSAEPREPVSLEGAPNDPCGNLRSFHAAITEGADLYPSWVDGARVVNVVFAAVEAARTGQSVDVPPLEALTAAV